MYLCIYVCLYARMYVRIYLHVCLNACLPANLPTFLHMSCVCLSVLLPAGMYYDITMLLVRHSVSPLVRSPVYIFVNPPVGLCLLRCIPASIGSPWASQPSLVSTFVQVNLYSSMHLSTHSYVYICLLPLQKFLFVSKQTTMQFTIDNNLS